MTDIAPSLIDVMQHYKLEGQPSSLLQTLWESRNVTDNQRASLLIAQEARRVNPALVLDAIIDDVMLRRTGRAGVASPLR